MNRQSRDRESRAPKVSPPAVPFRVKSHPRLLLLFALCIAIAVAALPAVSAGAGSFRKRRRPDGAQPGKIKHVWLIILENKSYDATFTGLNNNTYLWQTLPAQGVLLKNYYGTGHFSLDNYISMVSGQATQPDTQADCPYYDNVRRARSTRPATRSAPTPTTARSPPPQGPNAAAGTNGCVYPTSVPTLFNQLDAARRQLEGLRAGSRQPDPTATDAGRPDPRRAASHVLRRPLSPPPGATGSTAQPNPGSANATDQYVPKHFPFPWFESILQLGRLQLGAHRQPVRPDQRPLPRPAERGDDAGVQLDLAEQLQRRPRRRLPRQQPLGRLLGPEPRRNAAGQLHRRPVRRPTCSSSTSSRDRGLAGVQGRRPDRHHLRRGVPAVHLHRQQLRQLDRRRRRTPRRRWRSDTAGETLYGHNVHSEPTGPNTPLATDASGNELYPGPGDNAYIDRPSELRRADRPGAARDGTCLLGGGSDSPGPHGRRCDGGRRQHRRSSTTRSSRPTPAARSSGTGIPAGAFVGTGHRHAGTATATVTGRRRRRHGSFTLVDASGDRARHDGAVSGDHARRADTSANDPLYDATDADDRRRRHRQRADQPLHQAGHRQHRLLQPLQLAAHDGGPLRRRRRLARPRRQGHIGYAAQPGLAPFGSDVFTAAAGPGTGSGSSGSGGSGTTTPPPVYRKHRHKKHHHKKHHHKRHHKHQKHHHATGANKHRAA